MEAVIMVGNVGCGKSTLTKEYAAKGHKVFNGDAITTMVGAGEYKYCREDIPLIAEMREVFLDHCVSFGFSLVIDSTNMTKKQRRRITKTVGRFCTVTIVDFGPGTDESLQRRLDEEHGDADWRGVHNRFSEMYQKPEDGEADVIVRQY
jgi:predicted kinase